MRLPRDISGKQLAQLLSRYEYIVTRQSGSHIRLTTQIGGEHHITIPAHDDLRVGTLSAILMDIAEHLGIDRNELIESLFGK
jgi:predicted RNA binding protein YcfA (HicA-like mRNA interferase family)